MGEILLGSKRPPRARKFVRSAILATIVLVFAAIVGWIAFRRATSYPVPRGSLPAEALAAEGPRLRLGPSSLERVGELWVLRLAGAPYTLGGARARLLGARASGADAALDAAIHGERAPSGWLARVRHEARVRWRFRLLADGLPEARRQELAGLAAGLRAAAVRDAPSYQRLVWRQAAIDVGVVPGHALPVGGVATGLAFAVGGGVEEGGRVILGRAFALPGAVPPPEVVVTFAHPDGAIPWAGVGWAAQIGVVTGVNAEGIAIAVAPAVGDDVRATAAAVPLLFVARDVLERARTLDEAIAILKEAKPLGAGAFLVVDGNARTFAVVERSPGHTAVTLGKKAQVVGDLLTAKEFEHDAENDRARRTWARAARVARVAALLAKTPQPEPAIAAAVLRDRASAEGAELPLGNGNAVDDLASQHVAIIDASSMLLWVAEGPGAAGPLRVFDLRAELRGEASRLTTTLELPADPTLDPARARQVQLARIELHAARRLQRRGRAAAAAEGAARALALAPDLPEAHKLAADLARARGDDQAAMASYRRFLELHPAEPADIEEARAVVGGP